MTRRVKITLDFEVDLDMVPGRFHQSKDWKDWAEHQLTYGVKHYNPEVVVKQMRRVFKEGDILPNAARVIDYRENGDRYVVLADAGEEHAARFVTWRLDGEGNCYWGHYFKELEEAREEFWARH